MKPTPRTDASEEVIKDSAHRTRWVVPVGFARGMERELIEASDCLAILSQVIVDSRLTDQVMTPEFRARCEAITGPITPIPQRH